MDRRKIDIVLSALLIMMSIIILTNDHLVEGGSEAELSAIFLPRVVAGFILIFAAYLGIESLLKLSKGLPIQDAEKIQTSGFFGIVIYLAIFVLYWFAVPYVGFVITTPFIILAIAILLGGRNWLALVPLAVLLPLAVEYGARNFLSIYLPTWSLS